MKYSDKLEQVLQSSREFSKDNYGIRVGPDFSEFLLDVMSSALIKEDIGLDFMMTTMIIGMSLPELKKKYRQTLEAPYLNIAPEIAGMAGDTAVKWLYYGMKLGKAIAEEEMLQRMADKK